MNLCYSCYCCFIIIFLINDSLTSMVCHKYCFVFNYLINNIIIIHNYNIFKYSFNIYKMNLIEI